MYILILYCCHHTRSSLGVPGKTVGCMFTPIPVDLTCYEAERIGGKYKIYFEYIVKLEYIMLLSCPYLAGVH